MQTSTDEEVYLSMIRILYRGQKVDISNILEVCLWQLWITYILVERAL